MLVLEVGLLAMRVWADPDERKRRRYAEAMKAKIRLLYNLAEAVDSQDGEKVDVAIQDILDRADRAGM